MRSVGIKSLKNQLSAFVRLAESGETVLVTDRKRVVAELGPPRDLEGRRDPLVGLVRRGLLRPVAAKKARMPRRPRAPRLPLTRVLADLDRDRDER